MPARFLRLIFWKRLFSSVLDDLLTLWFSVRDPETPLWIKFLALVIPAYLLSPYDLIPDFLLVLGIVDDLIMIPLGLRLLIGFLPARVRARNRAKAADFRVRLQR